MSGTEVMLVEVALFDLPDGAVVGTVMPLGEVLSPDRRRTLRQAERITRGMHPLSGPIAGHLRLHPDASRVRGGPGPRCGDCQFREVLGHHNKHFAKCLIGDGCRASHSAASDVRAWWPACVNWVLAANGGG